MGKIKLLNFAGNNGEKTNIETNNIALNTEENITALDPVVFKSERTGKRNAVIDREDILLRKTNEKHYVLSDGTMRAEIFNEPVHYLDEQTGEYKDIDNRLVYEAATGEVNDFDGYINEQNFFRAKFAKNKSSQSHLIVQKGCYKLTWAFQRIEDGNNAASGNLSAGEASVSNDNTSRDLSEKELNLQSAIVYEDILAGVDLKYTMEGNRIKDYIIVKEKRESYEYAYRLRTENVTPRLNDSILEFVSTLAGKDQEIIFSIPAPIVTDALHQTCDEVWYEIENISENEYWFKIHVEPEWMNEDTTQLPILIDPMIVVNETMTDGLTKYKWYNRYLNRGYEYIGYYAGGVGSSSSGTSSYPYERQYFKLDISKFKKENIIRKIELQFTLAGTTKEYYVAVGETSAVLDSTVKYLAEDFPLVVDYVRVNSTKQQYSLDISSIVAKANQENKSYAQFVLKGMEENVSNPDLSLSQCKIVVDYCKGCIHESNDAVLRQDMGKAGVGSINLLTGYLQFEHEDFAWKGNRMPVTIQHIYNGNLSDGNFGAMKLGYGWKLNYQQKVVAEGSNYLYYDERAIVHVLSKEDGKDSYIDEGDGLVWVPADNTLTKNNLFYKFNSLGNLYEISDSFGNKQSITFDTSGRINKITDPVGRVFQFSYNTSNELLSITNPEGASLEFTISNNLLTKIHAKDADGVLDSYSTKFAYSGNFLTKAINAENNTDKLSVRYDYHVLPKVIKVTEINGNSEGNEQTITYDSFSTTRVTSCTDVDAADLITTYTFAEDGSMLQSFSQTSDTVIKTRAGSVNYIKNGGFNSSFSYWSSDKEFENIYRSASAYHGGYALLMNACSSCNNYVYQTCTLQAGTYTLSVYVKGSTYCGSASIKATNSSTGQILGQRWYYGTYDSEYERLSFSFTLSSSTTVKVWLQNNSCRAVYFSAVQLEKGVSATDYNYIENGNFELSKHGWNGTSFIISSLEHSIKYAAKLSGTASNQRYIYQTVYVNSSKDIKEEFVLSGWAKAYSPMAKTRNGNDSIFELRARICYAGYSSTNADTYEDFVAEFARNNEDWQYAEVTFSKSKFENVTKIIVYCVYDYNIGDVYFDDIQMTRNGEPQKLEYKEESTEEGDQISLPSEPTDGSESVEDPSVDEYGNKKFEITDESGEYGALYRTFGYDENGNNTLYETDEKNNRTEYTYDSVTSLMKTSKNPGRSLVNYEYYPNKQLKKMSTVLADGETVDINYGYDYLNNVNEIQQNGYKYGIQYDNFGNTSAIGLLGNNTFTSLVNYNYNVKSGRIKSAAYANGMTMECSYDSAGNVISETWKNGTTIQAQYAYTYDNDGNILTSLDRINKLLYTYIYNKGKILEANEYDVTLNGEAVAAKTLKTTIRYKYNTSGKTLTQTYIHGNESREYKYNYYNEDEGLYTLSLPTGAVAVEKSDHLSRKEFDEIQTGNGNISRKFFYEKGAVDHDRLSGNLKSICESEKVSRIEFADGKVLAYTYEVGGNIATVSENGVLKEAYTYDLLGRLKTEQNIPAQYYTVYTYDHGGNIISKKQYSCTSTTAVSSESGLVLQSNPAFTYDSTWKDKLTSYNGTAISYDVCGNPTSYKGNTLVWEKGRQLKQYGTNTYKYNASGKRISKTVGGVEYKYSLNGINIVREERGATVLEYMYDVKNEVCGFTHENASYYFRKNLQGDIIGILDVNGKEIAGYVYDAWGNHAVLYLNKVNNKEQYSDVDEAAFDENYAKNKTIAELNPFRYRGYYYDIETQLYYLQTRYYDPEIGRFINADDVEILLAKESDNNNLFNYCQGDPINRLDREGKFFFTITISLSTVLWGIAAIVAGGVAVWSITKLLEQLVRDLKRVIDDVKAKAKRNNKKKIRKAKHHIIAKAAPLAEKARVIWKYRLKQNIDDIRNLAYIWECYHYYLHNSTYFGIVNNAVSEAFNNGAKNKSKQLKNVLEVLAKLKAELESKFG